MKTDPSELTCVLATDCGSTTTKALMFEKTSEGWRQTYRGEAPTTVEEPVADVTIGALNAFTEVQELSKRPILESEQKESGPFRERAEQDPDKGIDLYLSTSSAGGGLQMVVSGVVDKMSTESASRAALGAGAIVLDSLSVDDGREDHERIERLRHLKPDIMLMTGGIDGGSQTHVQEMAETLLAAAPRPRFGDTLKLPVIYAGNNEAAPEVEEILADFAQMSVVENVRPVLEQENLGPAREAIHDFFLSHVMSHSPGYSKLLSWTPVPVMPTPAAVGDMVQSYAEAEDINVLCADIGGATTDVFSVFRNLEGQPVFNRTVSANLGMSYSVANVLIEAGAESISSWLPYNISDEELRDRLRNKMIRPTSIPQSIEDLWLEQAVCREALRLSLMHHCSLAVGLSGTQRQRSIGDIFRQTSNRYELVDRLKLDLVIGSGGVLSHAPKRLQAALMMLDGFALEGLTKIAVDSIFMMPHLGVFSSVHPEAAQEIFLRDCLVHVADAVVPVYKSRKNSEELVSVRVDGQEKAKIVSGTLERLALEPGSTIDLELVPLRSDVELGQGKGQALETRLEVGLEGLLLDGRGRPLVAEQRSAESQAMLFEQLGVSE